MNQTARHVLRLCVIASKVGKLPINTTRMCYSQITAFPYSSNTKDLGVPATSGTVNNSGHVIMKALSTAQTSKDILQTVGQYHLHMECVHAVHAFRQLDWIHRQQNLTDSSIEKTDEFFHLCNVVMCNIKVLNVNEVPHILKVCTFFGVPSTSVMSQSLLQLVRRSLTYTSFHSLVELQFVLKNVESTPLSDALLIAMPIMCEIQLNNKTVDLRSSIDLISAVIFVSTTCTNYRTIEMVINAVRKKGTNIEMRYAKRIFRYMCNMTYLPSGYKDVLSNLYQIIIPFVDRLRVFDIILLLGKIVKKVFYEGNRDFYNEEFIDACAETAISENFKFEEGVRILSALSKLNHTHIRLIDYLAAKCFENPQVLSKSPQSIMVAFVVGLASADYKPIFWESMQEIITKNVAENELEHELQYVNLAVGMAVLDFFDFGLIEKVFSENHFHAAFQKDKWEIQWNLLLLYQSVKIFCPKYTRLWPPQHIIDAIMNDDNFPMEKCSLLPTLEKALGGTQYVLSNLKSKIGHRIDHVVVMRKGGYPVALNSSLGFSEHERSMYIDDLQFPAESQVIIIINLPANAYAINSHRLKGNWTLLLKTLKTYTKHTVIPISSLIWTSLMDHEKMPYLMQAIRLKCDDMSASANVS